jgi:hypothetical protein
MESFRYGGESPQSNSSFSVGTTFESRSELFVPFPIEIHFRVSENENDFLRGLTGLFHIAGGGSLKEN